MESMTSSSKFRGWFNTTLFKKNVTRFWPIWGVYTAILAFLLPVELLLELSNQAPDRMAQRVENIHNFATVAMPVMGIVFGGIAAVALFSYLMDHRSVQLYHSLPIRREGLFLTNWLSGLCFFLVPNVALYLISALIEAGAGAFDPRGLGLWLVTATVCPMFFFCFTMCVAMFTGHILALPVFYGILNILVLGLCALMDYAGNLLLYNYSGNLLMDSDFARWCTPIYQLYRLLTMDGIRVGGVMNVACYCVVLGAVFTFIALGVYRLRQLERSGDVITVGWVRPVFQYGLGVCVGLLFGLVLYTNFFRSFGVGVYIFLVALCAVIGAFAGQMLLKKTLRVFAQYWKSCFALGLVMLAALWAVRADLTGFQRWVPDPAKVVSATLYGARTYPDDDGHYMDVQFTQAEDVARIIEIHKALNAELSTLQEYKEHGYSGSFWEEKGQYELAGSECLRIEYMLTDGSVVSRWYDPVIVRAEDLNQPGTWASLLNELANDPAVIKENYWHYYNGELDWASLKATGGWINRAMQLGDRELESAYAEEAVLVAAGQQMPAQMVETASDELNLTADAAQMLWKAFQEDLAAGRVKRYFLDDRERQENCYVSDIYISLAWTVVDEEGNRSTRYRDFGFTPEKSQTSVMKTLEELGLKEYLRQREPDYKMYKG